MFEEDIGDDDWHNAEGRDEAEPEEADSESATGGVTTGDGGRGLLGGFRDSVRELGDSRMFTEDGADNRDERDEHVEWS